MSTEANYFEFYGLPVALNTDSATVRRIYLENSRKYHPDFHTLSSEAEQDQSLELSTLNNEAFKTLSDPDRRLQYVLQLKGLLAGESANATLPPEFLMEMMEVNEKIMELEFDPNPALYQAALDDINHLESSIKEEVGPILETWTSASGTDGELLKAKDYFLKKRYFLRVKENLSKFAPAFE